MVRQAYCEHLIKGSSDGSGGKGSSDGSGGKGSSDGSGGEGSSDGSGTGDLLTFLRCIKG